MSILVILEQRGELRSCGLEAASAAALVARTAGMPLYALYTGKSIEAVLPSLAGIGIQTVYAYEHEDLCHYSNERHVPILCGLVRELSAQGVIGPASALGREFCASAAACLKAELIQDSIGVRWEGGLKAEKPIHNGVDLGAGRCIPAAQCHAGSAKRRRSAPGCQAGYASGNLARGDSRGGFRIGGDRGTYRSENRGVGRARHRRT